MARQRNGSTNAAPVSAEQTTETQASEAQPEQAPPPEPQGDGNPENPTTVHEAEAPQGEPGPEDFHVHSGARLIADHEQDLRLQEELDARIGKRANEIAKRTRKKGANAIVAIGGKTFQPRAKPGTNGETMILAEAKERVSASLD